MNRFSIKKSQYSKIVFLVILCFTAELSKGQSIPVGTPVLEDYYRRAQLMGQLDSSVSFTTRPFFPAETLRLNNAFDPEQTFDKEQKSKFDGIYRFGGKKGLIQLLPVTLQQQFNTHHPYSLNDGAMIPARGYQTIVSGGIYAKFGPLSIQLRPEVVFAENKPFKTFTEGKSDQAIGAYYSFKNIIDLPEYFPEKPYKKAFWGQSSIRLTAGPVSAGISSENLWWGPGMRNSLLMTNNAAGFNHFTLNTVKPIRTPIGSFEGQIIGGRLEPSGFFGADTNLVVNGAKLYRSKRDDWRYLSGMVFTYQPQWVPGLFLGLTRSFMTYHEDLGNRLMDYFPIFSALEKKSNYGEGESKVAGDQRASVFIRWLLLKEHAELYFEYGREDHAYDLRDLTLEPDHTRAYIVGFKKLFPLNVFTGKYIQVNIELTQLETNMTNYMRAATYVWYAHIAGIYHGYTNEGQIIGAGIGPGSNLQTATLTWGKGLKSIGIQVERYVHNNDLFYLAIKDIRAHWVDINVAALGEWNYNNLLFSAKLEIIRSLNYEYNYEQVPVDRSQYWIPGRDLYNFQANIGVSYRF
ncbi:MAG: capsule assembly Wzi family protein [Mariniphaga sp.]|nr:capsule assembly Wzi family protein [Mariniphaga sp.]